MAHEFAAGDNLVFQLESGYGIIRILAIDETPDGETVWHLSVLEDFFPDTETAELALIVTDKPFRTRLAHVALSSYAFEKTAAARLNNTPVQGEELTELNAWREREGDVTDRSIASMLGFR